MIDQRLFRDAEFLDSLRLFAAHELEAADGHVDGIAQAAEPEIPERLVVQLAKALSGPNGKPHKRNGRAPVRSRSAMSKR